jgi:hypothetical protein
MSASSIVLPQYGDATNNRNSGTNGCQHENHAGKGRNRQRRIEGNECQHEEQMLAKMEANWQIDREERKADRKAYQENLKRMMEEIMTANQAKTDIKLKELTETIEKTHLECEEPTSADTKACQ